MIWTIMHVVSKPKDQGNNHLMILCLKQKHSCVKTSIKHFSLDPFYYNLTMVLEMFKLC